MQPLIQPFFGAAHSHDFDHSHSHGHPANPHRRSALQSLLGLAAASAMPRVWAQAAPAAKPGSSTGRMVVVFLRGAYDGLTALVPYADRDYYALRPNIAVAAPDGSLQTALKLDATFALHPAMAELLPLWQQGVLSFVPAAGLPVPNRSHFDAQYRMEIANPGKASASNGWINSLAALPTLQANAMPPAGPPKPAQLHSVALGVGEANPAILAGSAPVKLIPRGDAAERTGVLANDRARQALLDLYAGNDKVSEAFRQGAGSRLKSAQELSAEKTAQALSAQMLAASNGAADPVGLQLDAQHLGTLMRNDRSLRLGFLSAGGWDTHANQGNATGALANNLGNLARGIGQLRSDFAEPGDVIIVMSEFGRTSAENGTRGTDHGFGNAMWLIGNQVNGGRWHGQWSGLARGNLNEGRDLPAHHDFRAVLAQALRSSFQLPDSQLASVLPGLNDDPRLLKLFKPA